MDRERCRACGWDMGEDPWEGGYPQHHICGCCGAESGVDDLRPKDARRWLRVWIDNGCRWAWPEDRPDDWSIDSLAPQLAAIGLDLQEIMTPPRKPWWRLGR